LALGAGAGLGEILYLAARPQRRIALQNLRIAFPEKSENERRAILRRSCRNLGRVAAEFCHLDELTPGNIGRFVRIADPDGWRAVVEKARDTGAVVLTAHLGNWELFAYAHALLGHPVTIVHRPMRNGRIDRAIIDLRSRPGTRSIAMKAAAREAIRALRARQLVAIPADQNQTRRYGVFADLFGLPASTTPGPTRLAALTGAPVIPAFLIREGETERHRLVFFPPIALADTGDREADIVSNTERCNAAIEQMLRNHPDQWILFHKRWRTRPEGEPRIYEA
jgi:Kdo2-lipid IVA lauroyltransferase/acyltransferase